MNRYYVVSFGMFVGACMNAVPVRAAKTINDAAGNLGTVVSKSGVETADLTTTAGAIIQTALSITGLIFLVLMVYAGFLWMTARGEEDQIDKAKKTIGAAILGLIVILAAYAITSVVTTQIST